MTTALVSKQFVARFGDEFKAVAERAGKSASFVTLPEAQGVRRNPRKPGEPVDELHPPSKLPELPPRADWIVIACPLTQETLNLLDAARIQAHAQGRQGREDNAKGA